MIKKLKENIGKISEPRRTEKGNLRHKLEDIMIIGLCTVISNGEDYEDMEIFGQENEEWLREKLELELPNGIPRSITYERVYEALKPEEVSQYLSECMEIKRESREVTPIDGKTVKGSRTGEKRALHVVSVWASEAQITLAEIAVNDKSNEIEAVKEILELVDIKGNIVTSDALNCQKEITEKITKQEADYVLCLKGNHEILHDAVEEHFMYDPMSANCDNKLRCESGHGRVEQREYWLETDINFLKDVPEIELWSNLNAVGMVKTVVEKGGKTSFEIRYFLASLTDINEFAHAVRQHWSIENQLHWRLDVIFREDDSKVKKRNAPMNLHILRAKSLSLLKNANMSKKLSMAKRRYLASLNTDVLEIILLDSNRAKS